MENQNNEPKQQRKIPSQMEAHEKMHWKVGDDIFTIVGGAEKKPIAFIKLERYDDNKKPVFSCRDLDGNSLSEETSNLYELKRDLKNKEIELTQAMRKKELSRENPVPQNAQQVNNPEQVQQPVNNVQSEQKTVKEKTSRRKSELKEVRNEKDNDQQKEQTVTR